MSDPSALTPVSLDEASNILKEMEVTEHSRFLIFYSSVVNGRMWCPDCVAVEDQVLQVFGKSGLSRVTNIVYIERDQWKTPASMNPYRQKPWCLSAIPTICRIQNGKVTNRLVEAEVKEVANIEKFVAS